MSDSNPDLILDKNGIYSACINYDNRQEIDWHQRKNELLELLKRYKNNNEKNWDCIVPVSGGKDSTYQVIRILELGLNPLCVTSTTCDESKLGRKNILNLQKLGVDHIQISSNPIIRAKLNRIGLTQVGDISWPEHVGIFTIPVRAAVQFNIPLIIWGENSQNEYGGPASASKNNVLNRSWLEEYGGLLGLRVSDLVDMDGIKPSDLLNYIYPTDQQLKDVGVTGLFIGHYLPWDGQSNAILAQTYGFKAYKTIVEGSLVNYENLDNHQTGIHDYFKFLKFGFGRATDLACLQIRRGRLTREDAIKAVRLQDGKFPWSYLGKDIESILKPLSISLDEFITICDRFTNKKLFKRDASGALIKDDKGNLTKINYDNQ
tara:strand:+ start:90 stop:1214 length:1125 start_codon:yes stop_codon:yes gene_type:complete